MAFEKSYRDSEPERTDVDALQSPFVIEFGTPWCGWCRAAQAPIAAAFGAHPEVNHIKVEDGSGRRLGRTFGVKLWPTLVFMNRGQEVTRLVRPAGEAVIAEALSRLAAPS